MTQKTLWNRLSGATRRRLMRLFPRSSVCADPNLGSKGTLICYRELSDAIGGRGVCTDISDHLGLLFWLTTSVEPQLIVELGTRGGESTRTLITAAKTCGSTLLSVDIDDCSGVLAGLDSSARWHFVQADDVAFANEGFEAWCRAKGLTPEAQVIFCDTSHEYEHTKQEIAHWLPHLAAGGLMLFHDSNMGQGTFWRLDGSGAVGWDNARGVIRAIEEHVGRCYDERYQFVDFVPELGLQILHFPNCNGLTVLRKFSTGLQASYSRSTVES